MKLQSVKTAEQLLNTGGLLYRGITGLVYYKKNGLVCADFLMPKMEYKYQMMLLFSTHWLQLCGHYDFQLFF